MGELEDMEGQIESELSSSRDSRARCVFFWNLLLNGAYGLFDFDPVAVYVFSNYAENL